MELALHVQRGLQLPLQARDYSLELGTDLWDFAVELAGLRDLGLSNIDIRWLLYNNYVVQARETTNPKDDRRMVIGIKKGSAIGTKKGNTAAGVVSVISLSWDPCPSWLSSTHGSGSFHRSSQRCGNDG
jgi:hypothetical protein